MNQSDDQLFARRDEVLSRGVPAEMFEFYRCRAEVLRLQAMGAFAARLRRGLRALFRPLRAHERSVCRTKNGHNNTMHSKALTRITLSGFTGP